MSTTVARLEQALGLRLIDRDSRNLRVTPEGETFYRQSLLIMEQVREADATVAGLSASPAGRLAAALPPAFTEEILAPRLAEFRARYPLIELDLIVTGHGFELLRDRVGDIDLVDLLGVVFNALAVELHKRLRDVVGERTHARAQPGGEHERSRGPRTLGHVICSRGQV